MDTLEKSQTDRSTGVKKPLQKRIKYDDSECRCYSGGEGGEGEDVPKFLLREEKRPFVAQHHSKKETHVAEVWHKSVMETQLLCSMK